MESDPTTEGEDAHTTEDMTRYGDDTAPLIQHDTRPPEQDAGHATPPKQNAMSSEHNATPPEHDATPSKHGATPPEHDVTPSKHDAKPPEHNATPPEHDATPPEHDATPPEHETTPPKQDATLPEHNTTPPEHETTPPEHETTPTEHKTTPSEHDATPLEQNATPPEHDAAPPEQDATPPEQDATCHKHNNTPSRHSPTSLFCIKTTPISPCNNINPSPQDNDVSCRSEESETEPSSSGSGGLWQQSSRAQLVILALMCSSNMSNALYGSLLAPFFPSEAQEKGASSTMVGLIFGCYPLMGFLTAPIFGRYLTKIGAKFMFVSSGLVGSGCAILFGTLEWCPAGRVYIGMCFAIRLLEAVAGSAASTAGTAICTHTFPGHISTVVGFLEAASCVGLVVGPPVGGALYAADGFYLPFAVSGGTFMCATLISLYFLPSIRDDVAGECGDRESELSTWNFFCIPIVLVVGFLVAVGETAIGFMDVALAAYLHQIDENITTVYIGLIFLVPAALVVLLAPLYGVLTDKIPSLGRPLMLVGSTLGAVGVLMLGPAPFLPFLPRRSVQLVTGALAVSAVGWASLIVTYREFVLAAKHRGFPDGLRTQGIISGVNQSFMSLGAFIGPTVGGVLLDKIQFAWSTVAVAGPLTLAVIFLAIYMVAEACCPSSHRARRDSDEEPLITNA